MDIELMIVVGVFLLIAVGALSLFFPKNDRKKVFYVAGAFVGLFLCTVASIWLISTVTPQGFEWIGGILGFAAYSFLLYTFGRKTSALVDEPKPPHSEANQSIEEQPIQPPRD